MLRRLGGCAIALALLLPAHAAATPAAADGRQVTTRTWTVKLGHAPVRTTTKTKVRLVFGGRRGQLVNLAVDSAGACGAPVLRSEAGRVKPWAAGYWRLPRTATYVAVSKPCRDGERKAVRVRRVVQHPAAVPGVRQVVDKRTRVTHLVPVRVATGQRARVEPGATVSVIAPSRRTSTVTPDGAELRAVGRHWVELRPGGWLDTSLTVEHEAKVDGTSIPIARTGTASTTHEVAFDGTAGQWVYAELLDAAGNVAADTGRDVRVHAPDGREVEKVVLHTRRPTRLVPGCTTTGPWLLPATGSYRMALVADTPASEQSITLRLRAAVVAPPLTVDGPAVTYAAASPGQWVISSYVDAPQGGHAWVQASNASASLGAWSFTMAPRFPWSLSCGEQDGNGCDEYWRTSIGPGSPRAETLAWTTPDSYALLVVLPSGQGSIDVALTTSAGRP